MSSAIIALDWAAIGRLPDLEAAKILDARARALERISKSIFAERGLILLEVQERRLWSHLEASGGQSYHSFEHWVAEACDYSRRDCFYSLAAMKELRSIPREDLTQIPRSNLEQLKKVSSSVRLLPQVIQAAKVLPERQFVEALNRDHSQHLEIRQPVVMAPGEVCETFEHAVERVIVYYECTRAEALEYIGNDILGMYPVEEQA
jgi:hypothetical protein